jgi:phosphoserine phosphatase RsbU/P
MEEGERWRIAATSSSGGVRQVQRWLENILVAREIAAEVIGDVELIAEEILTNIVRENTTPRGEVSVWVECALNRDEITLTFRDDGKPFDPLARAAPTFSDDVADRSVGGLGIHIVRELADVASYVRLDEQNFLNIRLSRTPLPEEKST